MPKHFISGLYKVEESDDFCDARKVAAIMNDYIWNSDFIVNLHDDGYR